MALRELYPFILIDVLIVTCYSFHFLLNGTFLHYNMALYDFSFSQKTWKTVVPLPNSVWDHKEDP